MAIVSGGCKGSCVPEAHYFSRHLEVLKISGTIEILEKPYLNFEKELNQMNKYSSIEKRAIKFESIYLI